MPARKATIVRTTAAKKQIIETIRNCRSTQKHQFKAAQELGKPAFTCALARKSIQRSVNMNTKRLILAMVVAFAVLWVTDFLIHGVWMTPDYRATQQLWRTDAEMQSHMAWMLGAQLLFVITFVILWAKGFASHTKNIACAVGYGLLMGLFSGVWALIMYVVVPMPGSIAAKWFFAGIVQTILLGLVTFWIYKPSAPAAET